jgi:antitoxin MazE
MVTKIQKWGNSQGLRIARHVLAEANISVGDNVEVTTKDGAIIISPAKPVRRKYDLRELVARVPARHRGGEIDWGKPVGREVW